MSIKQKFNNYFSLEDSDTEEEVVEKAAKPKKEKPTEAVIQKNHSFKENNSGNGQNIYSINQQAMKKPRIKIMEPRLYSEVQSVADVLLSNQSVIINFRRMEKEQAKKMIDFLMGTTYAIKGDIQRIGEEIFMCTPQSFEVDGAELQALKNNDY